MELIIFVALYSNNNKKCSDLRDKIRSLMVSQGIDAALITCNANLIYTYGCVVSGYLYLPLHSPALLFFKRPNNITGEHSFPIRKPEQIVDILKEKGLPLPTKLMLEGDELPYTEYVRLAGLFPDAEVVNGTPLIRQARSVKTAIEIEMFRRSGMAHAKAYEQIPFAYYPGMTDIEFSIEIERLMRLQGCLGIFRVFGRSMEIFMGSVLTGDNAGTAQAIARKANIGHYRSGVLPHDKAIFIEQLQQKGARVAMVGDGINDSAALAQADLSIAMGKGSDIAMETAMVTILSSDLLKIPETIRLSRLTVKTIRQNLFWAFIYNLVSIPIAAGILYPVCGFLLNPMIGGAAMAFSSVSVVSNSLRLKRKKISLIPRGNEVRIEEVEPINKKVMKKRFTIDGMMCGHCRAHVEKALNSIDGVKAIVTLDPPEATIEFTDKEFSLNELQQVIQNKAGDYKLHDLE